VRSVVGTPICVYEPVAVRALPSGDAQMGSGLGVGAQKGTST
jgi:hypothetical protein